MAIHKYSAFLFLKDFYFLYMGALPACLYHVQACYPRMPEEDVRFPETVVTYHVGAGSPSWSSGRAASAPKD